LVKAFSNKQIKYNRDPIKDLTQVFIGFTNEMIDHQVELLKSPKMAKENYVDPEEYENRVDNSKIIEKEKTDS
jgi:hypothetical protein